MKKFFILVCMSILALTATVAFAETTFTQADNGLPNLSSASNQNLRGLIFQTPDGQIAEFGIGGEIKLVATRAYTPNPAAGDQASSDGKSGGAPLSAIIARPVSTTYCSNEARGYGLDEGVLMYSTPKYQDHVETDSILKNYLWKTVNGVGSNTLYVPTSAAPDNSTPQFFELLQFHSHNPTNITLDILGTTRDDGSTIFRMPLYVAEIVGCYEITDGTQQKRIYRYYWLSYFVTDMYKDVMFKSNNTYSGLGTTNSVRTLFYSGTYTPSYWTNYWQ
ncbi:MAG: hypothetical protein LBV09_02775 [Deferribacteraceae bacterium]|nr:hypothetical protein [Deferribacteraceae bacterium]